MTPFEMTIFFLSMIACIYMCVYIHAVYIFTYRVYIDTYVYSDLKITPAALNDRR